MITQFTIRGTGFQYILVGVAGVTSIKERALKRPGEDERMDKQTLKGRALLKATWLVARTWTLRADQA